MNDKVADGSSTPSIHADPRFSELARLAGDAFVEASMCTDPEEAAELRQKAYKLVDLILEHEQALWEQKKR